MLKTAKIVGLNSDTRAALTLVSLHPSGLNLFIVVSCDTEDAFSRIRLALAEAEDTFYDSLSKAAERLQETFNFIKESLEGSENLQIIASAINEDTAGSVLYLICQGKSLEGYLIREGKRTNLCNMAEDGELISGLIEKGDRVILVTQSLTTYLGDGCSLLEKSSIDILEDEIVGMLPPAEEYPVAAIIIESELPKDKQEEKLSAIGPLEEKQSSRSIKKFISNLKFLTKIPKKGMALLGIGLILIILIGLVLNFKSKKDSEVLADFNSKLKAAAEEFSKADSLKDLDPLSSNKSLDQAKNLVNEALKIKPEDPGAKQLKNQIGGSSATILKVFPIADFPLWLDLDLVKKGLAAKNLSLSVGKILILDTDKGTLVSINLETKAPQLLAGSEKVGEAKLASLNGDVAWVFSKDKGIVKVGNKESSASANIKTDKDWGNIVDIYGFAGNLYLLDNGVSGGQIWKYLPIASGYSDKRAYLKDGVKVDFGNAVKMQIDSSVWVLKNNGEILKYTQGVLDYFSIQGLDKGVKDPKSFFVSDETDNLYLLDSGNSRLLVFDKKGVYKAQYQSDKFSSFTDLLVDEKGKKVYLLLGSKIFQMELR